MLNVHNLTVKLGNKVVIDSVSFALKAGKTLAVVGESGAGKSTLIAAILGLIKPAHGSISWSGGGVHARRPALVMQEPRSAFNPAMSLRHSVIEPLLAQKVNVATEQVRRRIERLCNGLELPVDILNRRPFEVSIGQAQRVGIMRALIAQPPMVLFDEPLSALDAVTQKHTAKLIAALQREEGFAALIVTHDLGYAVAYADEIVVLKSGCIEEAATAQAFYHMPKSEYCRGLRDAAIALGGLEMPA